MPLTLIVYLASISVRFRSRRRNFGHPAILTRPAPTTTVAPPKTTTTPDLPEQENEEPITTWNSRNAYSTNGYSTGYFGAGGDLEFDDDITTQQTWKTVPFTAGYQTTTLSPSTTDATEEPPEKEGEGQSQSGSDSTRHSGYCFCSPFSVCPRGSIARGGVCWDFWYYSGLRFIRCCYRPSVAKHLYFYHQKRK